MKADAVFISALAGALTFYLGGVWWRWSGRVEAARRARVEGRENAPPEAMMK